MSAPLCTPADEIDRAMLTRLRDDLRAAAARRPHSLARHYARKLTGFLNAPGALSAWAVNPYLAACRAEIADAQHMPGVDRLLSRLSGQEAA